MKYLASDYLDAIASREKRLIAVGDPDELSPNDQILVEQSQLDRLGRADFFIESIVLTEQLDALLAPPPNVEVLRRIFKYQPFFSIQAQIFSERHPIVLYTSTFEDERIAALFRNIAAERYRLDFSACVRATASLLSDEISPGYSSFVDSIADALDPPVELAEDLISKLSMQGAVGIFSMPLKGGLDRMLMHRAGEIVIFLCEHQLEEWDRIAPRGAHRVEIVRGYSSRHISWRRGDELDSVAREILARRNRIRGDSAAQA